MRAMVARIAPEEQVSLSLYAVVGAAAFLSGCVRYKSTAILIAMESTGAFFLIVPIAIAGGLPTPISDPCLPTFVWDFSSCDGN